MKKYLSYGGGVNSTAMLLLLLDEGWEFESVYVDHGCDWPETREYVKMMAGRYPITILTPGVKRDGIVFNDLYEFSYHRQIIPVRMMRWCTRDFKIDTLNRYHKPPAESLIGISTDEAHRAKYGEDDGIKRIFPLIDFGIDRDECKRIIERHGLHVPIKSGCWFCPFQSRRDFKKLRRIHPELFCRAVRLESHQNERRAEHHQAPCYISMDKPLTAVVDEKQTVMWPGMKPPCNCGL